jgi:hypothetical protein
MKVEILKNMASIEAKYKKGHVYDFSESTALSLIGSGHAKAVEEIETKVETQHIEVEKAVVKRGRKKNV